MASKDQPNIGVLISGSGTNLQAIIDGCESGEIPARVSIVISNREDAYGLIRAKSHNIAYFWIDRQKYPNNEEYDQAILEKLKDFNIDLVVLAGYMRLVGGRLLGAFPNAVINLHPSLLPSFPGAHGVRDALDYGVKFTGVTVHFADVTYDTGPIILQEAVSIQADDDESELLKRVHKVEYRLLPDAVKLWAQNRLKVEGRYVKILPDN